MHESSYARGRSAEKGCETICKEFLLVTMDCSASPGAEVIIDVDHASSKAVMFQLWVHVECAVNTCSQKIKLILSRFRASKHLLLLSKKFEDPSDLLLFHKALCPSAFICPQPGSANNVDEPTSSGREAHNDDTEIRNQYVLERIVEMVGTPSMKGVDEDDLEATINENIFDQDV